MEFLSSLLNLLHAELSINSEEKTNEIAANKNLKKMVIYLDSLILG